MQSIAAIGGAFITVLILFQLTKNVGTAAKPQTGLGEITSAATVLVGDVTK